MDEWEYFERAQLKHAHLRRRRPIGWSEPDQPTVKTHLMPFLAWNGSEDVLLSLADQQLNWLTRPLKSWDDDHWTGVRLSNGAAYLRPDLKRTTRCYSCCSRFGEDLSANAVGLCATVMLIHRIDSMGLGYSLMRSYRKLWAFVELHPEYDRMARILD